MEGTLTLDAKVKDAKDLLKFLRDKVGKRSKVIYNVYPEEFTYCNFVWLEHEITLYAEWPMFLQKYLYDIMERRETIFNSAIPCYSLECSRSYIAEGEWDHVMALYAVHSSYPIELLLWYPEASNFPKIRFNSSINYEKFHNINTKDYKERVIYNPFTNQIKEFYNV